MNQQKKKVIVSITGASGSIYADRFLKQLAQFDHVEAGVVFSKNAPDVWEHELSRPMEVPFPVYDRSNYRAPFASGSAKFMHMVIIPCSMGTLGRIAHGISDDLTTRSADVILKERRQLICVVRDTPLNLIHIDNMKKVTEAGGIILPAAPSFYSRPKDMNELVDTVTHRVLDLIGLDPKGYRWGEND